MNLKEEAGKLKSDVPALAMALKDAGTPTAAKTLAGITVAYALSGLCSGSRLLRRCGALALLVAATVKLVHVLLLEEGRRYVGERKAKAMVLCNPCCLYMDSSHGMCS